MKSKEIKKLSKEDLEKKLRELKLELVRAQSTSTKTGSSKAKEIKKMIARIHMLNASKKEVLENK
jgi:ribosomal protein L29